MYTRCNKPFENIWKTDEKNNGRALLSRNFATRQLEHVRRTFTRASAGLILRKVIPGDKYGQIVGRKWDGYVWKWRIPQNGSKWQFNRGNEEKLLDWRGITYFQTTQIVHTENGQTWDIPIFLCRCREYPRKTGPTCRGASIFGWRNHRIVRYKNGCSMYSKAAKYPRT